MRLLTKTAAAAALIAGMGALATGSAQATPITLAPSLSCAAGVCTASAVSALTPTEFDTLAGDNNTVSVFSAITIPLFNPALGTLTSYTVTVTGNETSTGTVSNTQPGSISGTASVSSKIYMTAPASLSAFNLSLGTAQISTSSSPAQTLSTSQSFSNLQQGSPQSYNQTTGPISLKDCSNFVFGCTGNDPLSSYIGVGTKTINLSSDTFAGSNIGGGNVVVQIATSGTYQLDVVYNYTPVCGTEGNPCPSPEPASMTLLGVGLVGVGAIMRRRRKAA